MKLIRNVYVLLQCSVPDWDGTITEQTNFHLLLLVYLNFQKVLYFHSIYEFININPLFQQLIQYSKLKLTMSMSSLNDNSNKKSVTLKFNISSVRVPLIPIWRRHLNWIPICCATMLCHFDRLQNGLVVTHFHPVQQHCHKQCYKRVRNRYAMHWSKQERKQTKEMKKGKRTSLVLIQKVFKWCAMKSYVYFHYVNLASRYYFT